MSLSTACSLLQQFTVVIVQQASKVASACTSPYPGVEWLCVASLLYLFCRDIVTRAHNDTIVYHMSAVPSYSVNSDGPAIVNVVKYLAFSQTSKDNHCLSCSGAAIAHICQGTDVCQCKVKSFELAESLIKPGFDSVHFLPVFQPCAILCSVCCSINIVTHLHRNRGVHV